MSAPAVTALIPVFNEAEALPVAVDRLSSVLAATVPDWEILIIESGSTDGTGELSDELAGRDQRVRAVHEGSRNGFGSAIRRGLSEARGERVWIVPVDLPFPLETLKPALASPADAIVSYRSHDPRSLPRRTQSLAFNRLAKAILGLRVRSVNSAFKIYRRDVVAAFPLQSSGWLIDAEILARLERSGATIEQIPVPIVERELGVSKVGPFDSVRIFGQLWHLRRILEAPHAT